MDEVLSQQMERMDAVRKATAEHMGKRRIMEMIEAVLLNPDPKMPDLIDYVAQVCCIMAAVELSVFTSVREALLEERAPLEEREKFLRMALGIKKMETTHLVLAAVAAGVLSKKEAADLCPYDLHTPEWHIYHRGVEDALGVDGAMESIREFEEHKK